MLNVSRTPVSETWLSSLPLAPKGHQALGTQAVIKIEQSRFSVSTINTDLFPELLSWSAMMNSQSMTPFSQNFPSDVAKHGDPETILEVALCLSAIFDPTTLNVGFDSSCFDGLDETLIYSPMTAYAEVCWADLNEPDPHSDSERTSTPTPRPMKSAKGASRRQRTRSPLVTSSSSDDSDTDSDECRTYNEGDASHPILGSGVSSGLHTVGEFSSYDTTKSLLYTSDEDTRSFMLFEPKFAVPNPQDSVGFFPIRAVQRRKSVSSRITAFRAHLLPGRLTFVRPPAP